MWYGQYILMKLLLVWQACDKDGGPGWFMGAAVLQLWFGVAVITVDSTPLSTK